MSWILAFLGFAVLIILHELGHFAVAKAVGMRVERFSLFFPPLVWRRQGKGETEYAIGAIPLGGYVKISGMNPHEELPPGQEHRAYFRQPVWKRIAVIVAGPVVNIVLAAVILTFFFSANGTPRPGAEVVRVQADLPANGVLQAGDVITSVDGKTGSSRDLSDQIATHRCEGGLADGCKAKTPAELVVRRDGRTERISISPVYDADEGRMRLGFIQTTPETSLRFSASNSTCPIVETVTEVIRHISSAEAPAAPIRPTSLTGVVWRKPSRMRPSAAS